MYFVQRFIFDHAEVIYRVYNVALLIRFIFICSPFQLTRIVATYTFHSLHIRLISLSLNEMATTFVLGAVLAAIFLSFIATIVVKVILQPYQRLLRLRKQGVPTCSFIPLTGHTGELKDAFVKGETARLVREQYQQYGSFWADLMGPTVQLKVNDPVFLAEILRKKARFYNKSIINDLVVGAVGGPNNLLTENGDSHAMHRKMISPTFRHENLIAMVQLMAREARSHVGRWLEEADNKGGQTILELHSVLSSMTLDVISASAFGEGIRKLPQAHEAISNVFTSGIEAAYWRFFTSASRIPILRDLPILRKNEVTKARQDLENIAAAVVHERMLERNSGSHKGANVDLLDLLFESRDEISGATFNNTQVREQATAFLLAGHETAASALTWTLFIIMHHRPELWEQVADEVLRICGDDATPTAEQLSQLKLTEAVLNESMRLLPPVPVFGRLAIEDHVLTGKDGREIKIEKGTMTITQMHTVHRLKEYWENPDTFDHTRWLGPNRPNANSYQFIPFSAGTRSCIGQNFAMLEMKATLAVIVQQCRMLFQPGQKLVDGFPVQHFVVTLRPRDGILVTLSRRGK